MASAAHMLTLIVATVFCLCGLFFSATEAELVGVEYRNALAPPPLSALEDRHINVLTLGHKNIYDDVSLFWLLQAILDAKKIATADEANAYIRAVLHPKPKIESMYLLSCFVMFEDFKRPEACQEIIMAGVELFPDSWRLPVTQGFMFAVPLKQPAQAARLFHYAAGRPGAPEFVGTLAAKLLRENVLSEEDVKKSLELIFLTPQRAFADFLSRHRK